MPNAYTNVDWIAAEALTVMSDELIISPLTARDKTADFMNEPNGYKVGDTVRIKTGPDYEAKEFTAGGNVEVQSVRSSNRNIKIEKHLDVSVEIGAKEKKLNFEGFSSEVIQPAAVRLAEKCDQYVGTKILNASGLY
nr:P22 phage major capsid protein family protein [Rhodobacter sp.]